MHPGSAGKTNLGIFVGILLTWVACADPFGTLPPLATWIIAGIAFLSHSWGCYNCVTGKGYSPLFTLFGAAPLGIFLSGFIPGFQAPAGSIVLIPICLLLLAILPDQTKRTASNLHAQRFSRRGDSRRVPQPEPKSSSSVAITMSVIAVIALLAVIGTVVYHSMHPQSVEDARVRALQQFPALAVANSPLNREFVARFHRYQSTNQAYFKDNDWPLHLAAESQAALDKGQAGR